MILRYAESSQELRLLTLAVQCNSMNSDSLETASVSQCPFIRAVSELKQEACYR